MGLHYGIARHQYFLAPANARIAIEMDWSSHAFVITALGLGKVSFAIFLMRITPKTKKWMKWLLHGYSALLVVINVTLIILTYAQRNLVAGLWDPTIGAKCLPPHILESYAIFQSGTFNFASNLNIFADTFSAYDVLADFVLALFPVVIIWDLNVNPRTKVGLATLMGLGVLCVSLLLSKKLF